jgi:cobalt-zinc-cadmium efflux system outer membrane protein
MALVLLALTGCFAPVRQDVDGLVCKSAQTTLDRQPMTGGADTGLLTLPAKEAPKQGLKLDQRLEVPKEITFGAEIIQMPDPKTKNEKDQQKEVAKLFPPLPDAGQDPIVSPGPGGKPLTLADLQHMAMANSPLIRQAAANVKNAEGAMIQAGLYFNPTLGITGQTSAPSGGPFWGPTLSQQISTMGKLQLAKAASAMDFENAQLAYRRAETDLMANVRGLYFQVLIADEDIRQSHALVNLTDEVYKIMVQQLQGGTVAPYEPMQLKVYSGQARLGLVQARNSYTEYWHQLAAAMGTPGMPATQLAGQISDLPIPRFRYDTVLETVLQNHTDVKTAEFGIHKARYNLRLAEVTAVPDFTVQVGLSEDDTPGGGPGNGQRLYGTFAVSAPIPVLNWNQGAVMSAKASLVSAMEEPHRVRDALTTSVADAYQRYATNFDQLEINLHDILPAQVQAFRATVQRHFTGVAGDVQFNDLVTAEQNLVSVIQAYFTVLSAQWQAVADLASWAQTDDVFQLAEGSRLAQLPSLEHLLPLECCHPCNPVPNPALKESDLNWPAGGMGNSKLSASTPAPVQGQGRLLAPQFSDPGSLTAPPSAAPMQRPLPSTLPPVGATKSQFSVSAMPSDSAN